MATQMFSDGRLVGFHIAKYQAGHNLTNYAKWLTAREPYRVVFQEVCCLPALPTALHPANEQQSMLASLSALQHAQCCSRCCHDAILMLLSLCLADPTTLPAYVQREWLCSRAGL